MLTVEDIERVRAWAGDDGEVVSNVLWTWLHHPEPIHNLRGWLHTTTLNQVRWCKAALAKERRRLRGLAPEIIERGEPALVPMDRYGPPKPTEILHGEEYLTYIRAKRRYRDRKKRECSA